MSDGMTIASRLAASVSLAEAAEILAVVTRRLAEATTEGEVLTSDQALALNSRARWRQPIPQLTAPDGTVVKVWIQAWTWKDRVDAETEAITWATKRAGANVPPAALEAMIARRQILEEVHRGLVDRTPVKVLEGWNDAILYDLHAAIEALAPQPARVLDAELQRIAGGPPPAARPRATDEPRSGGYTLPAQKRRPAAASAVPEPAGVGGGNQPAAGTPDAQ
jgi:hypothetical protein